MMPLLGKAAAGLLPAILYLLALVVLDSYKLVRLRMVLITLAAGCVAALAAHVLNTWLSEALGWKSLSTFARYVAPITEETLKALFVVCLLRAKKIGFMVDAAIFGFAAGTGFAIIENLYYLRMLPDANIFVWLLRGCGTAIMHGCTTAIFGIIASNWCERRQRFSLLYLLPGLALAIVLHSLFNHFLVSPAVTAVALMLGMPLVMIAVFTQSERLLERWLGVGFDTDAEMLAAINSGQVTRTPVGGYLLALKERFPPEVVLDMLCLLRINVELAIRAKGVLLMRRQGFRVPRDPDLQARLDELHFLERSIGSTGRLALAPLLPAHRKDLWQKNLLEAEPGSGKLAAS